MYKFNSISLVVFIIVLIQLLPHFSTSPTPSESESSESPASGSSAPPASASASPISAVNSISTAAGVGPVGTSFWGWMRIIKTWLVGPDGTIAVQRGQQGQRSSLFSFFGSSGNGFFKVNMEPQWSVFSLLFPSGGMQGILVKANPADACFNLKGPPKHSWAERIVDVATSNVTATALFQNWFLVAEDGYCDYNTKIQNANSVGYTILIIRQSSASFDEDGNPANSTIIDTSNSSVTIYTCTVPDRDGYHLGQYSYPADFSAVVTDLRPGQWKKAFLKLLCIFFGISIVGAAAGILVNEIVKKIKEKREAKEIEALEKLEEARERIAESLPTEKWRPDPENMRQRCQWCHRRFDHDDEVTALACSHMFHTECLVPRILRGHGYCPICQEAIHSPPTPESASVPASSQRSDMERSTRSTESTPLLSVKEKAKVTEEQTKVKKYHCHICEILGLPLKDELELVDELAEQVGTLKSQHYEFRIPSRHASLLSVGDSSGSASLADDDEAADAEVRQIISNSEADLLGRLHDVMEKEEEEFESPSLLES